ncbi:hypothetical protein DOY81_010171 [Sarcophaga bullata]|nr:hypothetical protein DOY81_010171 [Sarcophaga bullata]
MYMKANFVTANSLQANAAFYIKSSNQRYQPFLYNTTADFCKFMRNENSYPFWKIIMKIIKQNSNINHTCPFNHDIIVENLVLGANMIKLIPFASGDYLVALRIGAYNDYKAEVRVYVLLKE